MLNGKIEIINRSIFKFASFNARFKLTKAGRFHSI